MCTSIAEQIFHSNNRHYVHSRLSSNNAQWEICMWGWCLAVFETQSKSCRSPCLESQITNIRLKKNQQKVPGPPPKLSSLDRRTCGNLQHWCFEFSISLLAEKMSCNFRLCFKDKFMFDVYAWKVKYGCDIFILYPTLFISMIAMLIAEILNVVGYHFALATSK